MTEAKTRVLIVYYSFTQQARRVAEATADVLRDRGCEVRLAAIEFTDDRYADRFSRFPFRRVYYDLFTMLPAQLRRATGQIRVPEDALADNYDLICIGSPTWWLTTCMPVRSFLKSEAAARLLKGKRFAAFVVCRRYWRNNLNTVRRLGVKQGGTFIDGIHFVYEGGQVRSMLSLISFLGTGEYRQRYLGVKIPPTNLKVDFSRPAHEFANRLADNLQGLKARDR
jgi:menaquinone-dependent protoporphyrinogen IX oxidase